ncbi:MAG TPA: fasciclin domain-containing protein [Streptosporangiaceae bacterium]|nr:fasciclin domain-containing protein [Streptosporangiaceae bacterium]
MQANVIGAPRRAAFITASITGAVLVLAAAGCGSSAPAGHPAASGSGGSAHPMHSHSHAMTQTATFGPDCSMVPGTGMGSFHSMSMEPVVTAARHNRLITTFAADVTKAGLTGDLNNMHAFTVFAPANSAFATMRSTDTTMLHNHAELAKVLSYHVVSGRVTPHDLASGMTLKTLEGDTLTGAKMGSVYEVNNAHVICGNIQTANATIYVISKVLIPMH